MATKFVAGSLRGGVMCARSQCVISLHSPLFSLRSPCIGQILHGGLLGPAVGVVGFEFKFGDGLNRVTGRQDFGVGGVKPLCGCDGPAESATASLIEAVGN